MPEGKGLIVMLVFIIAGLRQHSSVDCGGAGSFTRVASWMVANTKKLDTHIINEHASKIASAIREAYSIRVGGFRMDQASIWTKIDNILSKGCPAQHSNISKSL